MGSLAELGFVGVRASRLEDNHSRKDEEGKGVNSQSNKSVRTIQIDCCNGPRDDFLMTQPQDVAAGRKTRG